MLAARHGRFGFTLIEMLVALALVLLMMVLFAEVFQIAAETVSRQKGLGENDQRARTLTTIIKGDLDRRTFRAVRPFKAGENVGFANADMPNRRGYFYISENEPLNDTDDVLQFTIELGADEQPLTGRVRYLPLRSWEANTSYAVDDLINPTDRTAGPSGIVFRCEVAGVSAGSEPMWPTVPAPGGPFVNDGGTLQWEALDSPLNQPEGDDGHILFDLETPANRTLFDLVNTFQTNNTGASTAAEVSYFLRNGVLYRRVLLLRKPYELMITAPGEFEPRDSADNPLIPGEYDDDNNPATPTTLNFWTDFDYSATSFAGSPRFAGLDDLDNAGAADSLLARLGNRFGHDHQTGQPREFVDTPFTFIGRFTHQETSDQDFAFPGRIPDLNGDMVFDDSPMDRINVPLGIFNGVITHEGADMMFGTIDDVQFLGTRRGEDILLTNVHSFDVKLWDEAYNEDDDGFGDLTPGEDRNGNGILDIGPAFADVGHAAAGTNTPPFPNGGFFAQTENEHFINMFEYGPRVGFADNRVFDTWHHDVDISGDAIPDDPPFVDRPTDDGIDMMPGTEDDVITPVQAIQITIRYYDPPSDQMRQLTLVHSLVD